MHHSPIEHAWPGINIHDGHLLHVQIMENKAMKKLVKVRNEEILLIEHRRAHNICIELAGVRMPFSDIKVSHHTHWWRSCRLMMASAHVGLCTASRDASQCQKA